MKSWELENKLRLKHAKKKLNPMLQKLKNPYVFEIEDHTQIGSDLEHGNLFDKWLVKKINMH